MACDAVIPTSRGATLRRPPAFLANKPYDKVTKHLKLLVIVMKIVLHARHTPVYISLTFELSKTIYEPGHLSFVRHAKTFTKTFVAIQFCV